MTLHREIRMPPKAPTALELRALLREYGIKRWQMAKAMGISEIQAKRYLLPPTSKHVRKISLFRWQIFRAELDKIDARLNERSAQSTQSNTSPQSPPSQ